MTTPLCRYSGTVLGGYIEAHRSTTIQVTCIKCWRRVVAAPIPPEWRTNLRIDGQPMEVLCKRVQDHPFGTACAMRWRRDRLSWMFRFAMFLTLWSFAAFVWGLVWRF
jgi:hypothetical protein